MRSPGRRRAAVRLLAIALGFITALALSELLVRRFAPQPFAVRTPGLYQADPPGRFALRPGFHGELSNRVDFATEVRVNAQGLRGPAIEPRVSGRLRILALGDSYTFGYGVAEHETFCARLAVLLNEAGRPSECLNGGVPGYGVRDERLWLERHGLALEPDLVLLAVYVGNDLKDAVSGADPIAIRNGLVDRPGAPGGLRAWLNAELHLVQLLKGSLPLAVEGRARRALGLAPAFRERNLSAELESFSRLTTAPQAAALASIDADLAVMAALAHERGFRLAAMLIPHLVQIDRAAWERSVDQLGIDPARYDVAAPTRQFQEQLLRSAIPTLDMTAALAAAVSDGRKVVFAHDHHWNAAGHALAAEQLRWFLEQHGLLGATPAGATAAP